MAFPVSALCNPNSPVVVSLSFISNSLVSLVPFQANSSSIFSTDSCSRPFSTSQHSYSCRHYSSGFRIPYRSSDAEEEDENEAEGCSFDEAVALFNTREYYKCHDFLESLWNKAEEPTRTLFHGGDDVCVAMDRSERSYQLLGRYAEGQLLYTLQLQADDCETMYIVFRPQRSYSGEPPKVKLPTLNATTQHLSSHGL